ncbi:MAG: nitronate monooxygenase, partial [Alphaproteobacteria bacterium]|nr:nitronate monooxygenase [Alphaproteobacteria bacterium]
MFLTSGPDLVVACCSSGVVGSFPALNQRSSEGLSNWLAEINTRLSDFEDKSGFEAAPYAVNLIVHKSNPRLQNDLDICVQHKVPIIITSLGAMSEVVERIHDYGGRVFHDVTTIRHARKAAAAGVDGLIVVAAGAGGHAGQQSPFALVNEIKSFYKGIVILAGSISTGRDVAAAQMMGADFAYMGTRFIATQEAMVSDEYKDMIVSSGVDDIVYTPKISGVNANFLKSSIERAGLDLADISAPDHVDFGGEIEDASRETVGGPAKPWKDLWSAGHGVGSIHDIPDVASLIAKLE